MIRPIFITALSDRGVVRVIGADAAKFLQGLISNDLETTETLTATGRHRAIHAGLLSPQGKILYDFFVAKAADGYVLDVANDKLADLIKRLSMYKLRANVTISDASADHKCLALWGKDACSSGETIGTVAFDDPRLPAMGLRILAEARFATDIASATNGSKVSEADYHAHRIALGVPEGGKDYDFGDAYPHEANFDLLNGVSFSKGCYVGQEIVARMQHKTVVRKRVIHVQGSANLTAGMDVVHRAAILGRIGSVDGNEALALVRLDRFVDAIATDDPVTAAGVPIGIRKEDLLRYLQTVKVQN